MAGMLVGGFIGFLARPSAAMVGQLPLSIVLTRGAMLEGLDRAILLPLAEQSFNTMGLGILVGMGAGWIIGSVLRKQRGSTGNI